MDVHQASIVIVVLNDAGKVVMELIIETGADTVRSFIKQLRGQEVQLAGAASSPGKK
jgi:hypothetical protein